jgi:hypothetical protein
MNNLIKLMFHLNLIYNCCWLLYIYTALYTYIYINYPTIFPFYSHGNLFFLAISGLGLRRMNLGWLAENLKNTSR